VIVRLIRYLLVLFLIGVALAVPAGIYVMNQFMASIVGTELTSVIFISNMGQGFWLLLISCGLVLFGAMGLLFLKNWGRILAISGLGLFAAISVSMALFPSDKVQSWYTFYQDRAAAAVEALIYSSALAWLCSPLAKKEFCPKRKLA